MYGGQAWTILKQVQKKLEATDMWLQWRMLQISWSAKKSNETLLYATTSLIVIKSILKCQETLSGHVMRREKLEHLSTGMIKGNRSKGKQREKKLDGLTKWLKIG